MASSSSSLSAIMGDMSVPPGFTRRTTLTTWRVERDVSVAMPVHPVYSISDSDDEEMPNQSFDRVIADAAVTGTSLQRQRGRIFSGQMSGPGESSRAGGTTAAPTGQNEGPSSSAGARNNMPALQLNLPCFVQVGQSRTIEILEYGTVMPGELWSTREYIFPKGFRSRAQFWSVVEPNKNCFYISEIKDAGGYEGPQFRVSVEGHRTEVFVHICPKRCWDLVVERVNKMNISFYQENKKRGRRTNPFRPVKPGSVNGLEMFGLSESTVHQDLEALDIERQSLYCRLKNQTQLNRRDRRAAHNALAGGSNRALLGLLNKANPEELAALETVLRDTSSSSTVRQEAILLLDEIRSRRR